MTNYRSELQKLIASFDEHLGVHNDSLLRAVEEARASLEEPVAAPAGPTDDELLALVPQGSESDFYLPKGLPSNWDHGDFIAPPEAVVAFARAVLARYGHQSAPPTEGDVGELVAALRSTADGLESQAYPQTAALITRAAYLLAHHHPAPPTEGEVGELIERLNLISVGMDAIGHESDSWFVARAATLLKRRHPAPAPPAEGEVAGEPAVPEGREPTRDELWELWLRLNNELPDRPAAVAEFWEHAQIDARSRYSHQPAPPTEDEVADLVAWLCDEADQYDCIQQAPDTSHKLRRAAELIGDLNNSRSKS